MNGNNNGREKLEMLNENQNEVRLKKTEMVVANERKFKIMNF